MRLKSDLYAVMADLFPLGLSITTLILLTIMYDYNPLVSTSLITYISSSLLLDFCVYNPVTARPPFEIGFLVVLSIFWLGEYGKRICLLEC